ncbi:MAG: hypothetical protein ACLSHR_11825 [Oscillospiraceae bacterium]
MMNLNGNLSGFPTANIWFLMHQRHGIWRSLPPKTGANGIDAADMEKYGKLKAEGMLHRKSQDIVVSLLGSDIQPAFYGYGIEGAECRHFNAKL